MRKKPNFSLRHPCVPTHVSAREKKREEGSEGQKKGEGRERGRNSLRRPRTFKKEKSA